jgi:acetolactate synthase-1/2/3 large subunit
VRHFLNKADVIFGIGCSFGTTNYGVRLPREGPVYIQATLDPADLNKELPIQHALLGDAELTLRALIAEIRDRLKDQPRGRATQIAAEISSVRDEWLAEWKPKLTSNDTPLSPYRVIWDLLHTVDVANTIITHDAGSPRDQLAPFWRPTTPLSYIGWGKTTQLGYGLGLAMGAKLARPDKLCINVWGDAAIGFTGMDFEVATEKYRSTDISGNYADMARAFGGYGERVTEPGEIKAAIRRGIEQTQQGRPALLEFITQKEVQTSDY